MAETAGATIRVLGDFAASSVLQAEASVVRPWLDVAFPGSEEAGRAAALSRCDVIWHGLRPLGAADFDQAPNLRLVQKFGVGFDTVDLDAARARGVAVANMPGVNAPAVAEGAVMLILAAIRALPEQDRRTRAGLWMRDISYLERSREVAGLTVGLVGYGDIAKRIERVLLAMGACVLHTSTKPDGSPQWRSFDDLLAASDVVSLHVPGNAATRKLFGAEAFAKMRAGAVLVNTARGSIVDEQALLAALESGHLAAAGLDVFEQEPVDPQNPLLGLSNVVVTPHLTWLTEQTNSRMLEAAVENCRRLREGEPFEHRII
ncbi:D-isomer specific 2-hydroxyacid dehydrogenase NAD-binding protein [Segniliparus rotundus DSM 44985]|uniref:D-isomer specific 2-hydroxyacid dehydrogenase NAD-binding protein n=1 Tax=Segniliparus rotundus (strain ATCC BAA-972 / CDC 1076 / CIP 108378 / DSM 44985 / JCM 13578) TaxID=640132 RepID=D6ZC96_SEGRD|nr:2-hydroxyacid dehydrogenase [Segniliparus rotundus]ADG99065.1 D-isomer specific 2-hydroxyacid dehydrogenase NAD-binding protein [Segniliparus rotundus DSM 44985]